MDDPLWDSLDQFKQSDGGFGPLWPTYTYKRFWSPDDDVHGAIKAVIASATKTIDIAMYGYDDDELDDVLEQKWLSSTIAMRMCLDKTEAGGVHERALLAKWNSIGKMNLPYVIGSSRKHAISHLKLVVVDGLYTIQGSTNWSASGETKQNNECSIFRDPAVAADSTWKVALTYTEMAWQQQKVSA